jgi:hypothetical protein
LPDPVAGSETTGVRLVFFLRPTDHVALEATTNSWAVADALRPHVGRVVASNPLTTKAAKEPLFFIPHAHDL